MSYKKNEQKNGIQLFEYNESSIAFNSSDGKVMVNATQMAKSFGKQPIDWLKHEQSKLYIKTLSKLRNLSLADLQQVIKGGNNPGTWLHEDVAIEFARWLNPEFGIWCNDMVKEMIKEKTSHKLTETATYKDGELFSKKLGNNMIACIYTNSDFYYSLNGILSFLGVKSSTGSYAKRTTGNNAILLPPTPSSKQKQWFVNFDGVKELSVYFADHITSHGLEIVYSDLFRRTLDGITTTKTRHPYKFTHEEMNELFYLVSKIGRVKLQNEIYELLRGGLK